MKKLISITSLILITIFSIGCSRDDDGVTGSSTTPTGSEPSSLIGTWNLDYYIDGSVLTEEIICDEKVEYIFTTSGNYTQTTFAGTGTTNCLTAVTTNGTWVNISGNDYELTPNGSTNTATLDITFQDDFTKFVSIVSTSRTEVFSKQ